MRPARLLLTVLLITALTTPSVVVAQNVTNATAETNTTNTTTNTTKDEPTTSTLPDKSPLLTGQPFRLQRPGLQKRKEAIQTQWQQRQATRPAKMEERQEEMKAKRIARFKERFQNLLEVAQRHLERLNNIFERVQSRIAKFKQAGKDVSSLEPLVEQAFNKKAEVVKAIEQAKSEFAGLDLEQAEKPRESAQNFINTMKKLHKAIVEYHQAIVNIIRNMKGASIGTKVTPSSAFPTITEINQ